MATQIYNIVAGKAGKYIAGIRLNPGQTTIELTPEQADYEVAQGTIVATGQPGTTVPDADPVLATDLVDLRRAGLPTRPTTAQLAAFVRQQQALLVAADLPSILPSQGTPIYFRKPANLRRWQAALAKLRAGTYRPKIVFDGDSKKAGTGAGAAPGNSWSDGAEPRSMIAHVVKLLNAAGIPANRNCFFGSSGLPSPAAKAAYDPRLTFGSGWTGGATTLGGVSWINPTNAQPLTFAPSGPIDRCEAYFRLRTNDAQGSLTLDSDPTVLATMNAAYSGAEMPGKAVATFARGAHTINVQRSGGSNNFTFIGMIAQDSTVPAVDVINAGSFGSTSAQHASTNGSTIAAALCFAALAPDLVVIQLGTNDLNTNVTVETYTANILNIITAAKAAGADVVLEIATFGNAGSYGTDVQREAYRQALIGLGASQGCMVIDHAARFISFANANALGLMKDNIHEAEAGYADQAQAFVDAVVF